MLTETVTVPQAAAVLGLSRNSAYKAIHTGDLPHVRIGRRLLVPRLALERLLSGQQAREAQR